MKIAQVVCAYPPYRGGIGKVAQAQSKFLKSRNHQVTVFSPSLSADLQTMEEDENICRLTPTLRLGNGAFLPQLLYRLNDFDIVYLHYPFFGSAELIFLLKLFFRKKFKLVIHYHMDVLDLSLVKRIFTWPSLLIRAKLFKLAEAVVCASLDYVESSEVRDVYKKYPDKFHELPFSVDTKIFCPLSSNNKTVNITFVGGMDQAHYFKGVEVLLRAFAKLEVASAELHLIGNGSLIEDYKKLSQALGISSQVHFHSGVSDQDLIAFYQTADIFVLPSINRHEAFGMVLLEALSCGVPVIASRLPGVRTVFEDNQQGLFVAPGDESDLKNKISKLVLDAAARKRMGEQARVLACQKYSFEKNNQKLEDLLLAVLKQ